jgi:Motility quorum-sensing regulator, toxin of MqsA
MTVSSAVDLRAEVARREFAALGSGLDPDDACDGLLRLEEADFHDRLKSERDAEWLYVFKPTVAEMLVYVRLAVRATCLVVSFHEDEDEDESVEDDEGT